MIWRVPAHGILPGTSIAADWDGLILSGIVNVQNQACPADVS